MIETVVKRKKVFQYVFANIFPVTYLQVNKYGIKIRNEFSVCFSEWLNENIKKEQLKQLGKQTNNYKINDDEKQQHPHEQKPITNDANKENIPPTLLKSKIEFDKKYALPTVKKRTYKIKNLDSQDKNERLKIRLSELDEKMKLIKGK